MGAVKRTNLEITLSKCELKTDELGMDRPALIGSKLTVTSYFRRFSDRATTKYGATVEQGAELLLGGKLMKSG